MGSLYYVLGGAIGTAVLVLLFKIMGSRKTASTTPLQDTKEAQEALEKASELLGRRAAAEAAGKEDRQRVEEKLLIEDPVKRLNAIADELKDL